MEYRDAKMRFLILAVVSLCCFTSRIAGQNPGGDLAWRTGKLVYEDRGGALAGVYSYGFLSIPLYRNVWTYVVEAEGYTYVAQERIGVRAARKPTPFIVNAPVRFALDKGKFYLTDEEGKVHAATIVKQVLKDQVASHVGEAAAPLGSGFVFSPNGHVLTNLHVVKGCQAVSVRLNGIQVPAQVLTTDVRNDLAVLKIEQSSAFLSFREDQRLKLGENVVAVGYPLQGVLSSSMNLTTGTLSSLAGIGEDTRMLQFSAAVQPGSSGGPLLDQSGHVVAVITGKLSPLWAAEHLGDIPENVNFATKASVARDFLDSKGIEYSAAPSTTAVPTPKIAEQVMGSVASIACSRGQ